MFPKSVFSVFQNGLTLISPNYLAVVNSVFIPVMRKMRPSAKKEAVAGERGCSRNHNPWCFLKPANDSDTTGWKVTPSLFIESFLLERPVVTTQRRHCLWPSCRHCLVSGAGWRGKNLPGVCDRLFNSFSPFPARLSLSTRSKELTKCQDITAGSLKCYKALPSPTKR